MERDALRLEILRLPQVSHLSVEQAIGEAKVLEAYVAGPDAEAEEPRRPGRKSSSENVTSFLARQGKGSAGGLSPGQ